ncbi:ATP-binding protein [Azospirillum halopraeferens]|uniref:ATP-binding protein n=1 Tax=Azospirillum halopraeferens TaxID=34010 RepID=UPI000409E542|nr:AAA family ATPase [Azospirillum halopraeferens]
MAATSAEGRGLRTSGSERRLLTVLFADIVGSSRLVDGCDPEDADESLLGILQVLVDAVHRYGGMVSQVLGDGVLAVFGAPAALEDHALRACLAARDIAVASGTDVASGDADGHRGALPPFSVRVGVASGEVLSHVVDADGPWKDYRAVGECVHLAAKLQQRAAPGSVLISADTVRLVPAGLISEPVTPLALGGDAPPHPVHRLVDARPDRLTATDFAARRTAPFVGREAELRLIDGALRRAVGGEGGAMLVVGEAGIGKSRVVGELLRMHRGGGIDLVEWPQAPLRRPGDPDTPECVVRSLAALAARRHGGDGATAVCAAARRAGGPLAEAAVCDLLGQPVRDPLWTGIDPAQRLSFAIEGLAAATVELGAERTVVVLVEDAHWADPVMARLLDTLAHGVAGSRIFLLATARPDEPTGWSGVPRMPRLDLNALSPAQTDAFLDHWLGDDPSLTPLKHRIARRSEGVPLYLEESLRALESAGTIAGTEGAFRLVGRGDPVELPASVRGLLAARIDALPADRRAVLRAAAVVGPTFDVALLCTLVAAPAPDVMKALAGLEWAGFLHRSRLMPNLEFTFHHALMQEVAYAGIARRERQCLHARIVAALRKRRDSDLPGRLESLAHHALRAGNRPLAYVYGRFAGQRAEVRSGPADAAQHFTDALHALEGLPASRRNTLRRIDVTLALARSLLPQGGKDGIEALLNEARNLAMETDAPIRRTRASSLLSAYLWIYGDLDDAIRLCREGLAEMADRECLNTRVQLLVRLAGVYADKGHYRDACTWMEEAGRLIAAEPGFGRYGLMPVARVAADSFLGRYLAELGRHDRAMRCSEAALDAAQTSGHAFSRILAMLNLSLVLLLDDRFDRAIPLLKDALETADVIRSQLFQPILLSALGYALVRTGKADDGLAMLHAGRQHLDTLGVRRHVPQVLIWLSLALHHAGRPREALRWATDARDHAAGAGQQADEARACYAMALAGHALGRDGATALAAHAADTARLLGLAPLFRQCERLAADAAMVRRIAV